MGKQIVKQRYAWWFIFVITPWAVKSAVSIDNGLAHCVTIKPQQLVVEPLPILSLSVEHQQLIAQCGCRSMLAKYSSRLPLKKSNIQLMSGQFIIDEQPIIKLPIATSARLIGDATSENIDTIKITISCAM